MFKIKLISLVFVICCSLVKCQDCDQFGNDLEILNSFPFEVNTDYKKQGPTISTAILDGDSVIMIQLRTAGFQVPQNVFCLKNLKTLDVMNMNFENGIVPDTLSNLQLLFGLSIKNCALTKVTDKLSSLKKLESLTIDNCGLNEMPSFDGLMKLNTLSLPNNRLSKLEGLYNVTQLFLYHNQFNEVPTQVKADALVRIYMNFNPVQHFPNIETHINLTEIRLSNTQIYEIPSNIDQLKKLSFLDLSFSKITTVPENIFNIPRLTFLVIQGNSFSLEEIDKTKNLCSTLRPDIQLLI